MANYRYNGVELPALPDYDKTAFPFCVIGEKKYESGEREYVLYTISSRPYADYLENVDNNYRLVPSFPYSAVTYDCYISADGAIRGWERETEQNYPEAPANGLYLFYMEDIGTGRHIFWTNFDVYYGETIAFYASDPVPVGGEPTLTARDLYRKIDGKPTKLTLYKKVGGKLIPLDEYTKEVKT